MTWLGLVLITVGLITTGLAARTRDHAEAAALTIAAACFVGAGTYTLIGGTP